MRFAILHDPKGREVAVSPDHVVSIMHVLVSEAPHEAITSITTDDGKFQFVREPFLKVKEILEST